MNSKGERGMICVWSDEESLSITCVFICKMVGRNILWKWDEKSNVYMSWNMYNVMLLINENDVIMNW